MFSVTRRDFGLWVGATLVAVSALGSAGCKKATAPVSVSVNKASFNTGETIIVAYSRALTPPSGQQYWVTLVPAGSPDSTWGAFHYVNKGASTDVLTATAPGSYEVRLHDNYPQFPYKVLARQTITVAAAAPIAVGGGGPYSVTLAKQEAKVGEMVSVNFGKALSAPAGQQYWISVAPVGSPDSTWGEWHYVPKDAAMDNVKSSKAGTFEVRLQDFYPAHSNGVLARQTLVVK